MIIFYNKKTGETVGTVDGRVHGEEHLKMLIVPGNLKSADIENVIIGWTEDAEGRRTSQNHHLFPLMEEFEDPKNPKTALNHKVKSGKTPTLSPVDTRQAKD